MQNGFMANCIFNAIESETSMSTHAHGFSFPPAKSASFDQAEANNRCTQPVDIVGYGLTLLYTTIFLEMAVYTLSRLRSAEAYLSYEEAGEREKRKRLHISLEGGLV